jgi:uncharacterized membrane protein
VSYEVTTLHQGPLPSPDVLQGFENVVTGAADRVIRMAEREQEARLKQDKAIYSWGIFNVILGMVFGILALIIIGYLIIYAIDHDAKAVASILASITVATIGTFIWFKVGRKSSNE